MFIPYSDISNTSKVWIYQANKKIDLHQKNEIQSLLVDFCHQWFTHGKPVISSVKIYDWFICFFVDEKDYLTSGCSIDKSISLVKSISKKFSIDFFDRKNIIFYESNNIKILPLEEFRLIIKPDIIVFNNMVQNKQEFENKWKTTVKESWLNRFLV